MIVLFLLLLLLLSSLLVSSLSRNNRNHTIIRYFRIALLYYTITILLLSSNNIQQPNEPSECPILIMTTRITITTRMILPTVTAFQPVPIIVLPPKRRTERTTTILKSQQQQQQQCSTFNQQRSLLLLLVSSISSMLNPIRRHNNRVLNPHPTAVLAAAVAASIIPTSTIPIPIPKTFVRKSIFSCFVSFNCHNRWMNRKWNYYYYDDDDSSIITTTTRSSLSKSKKSTITRLYSSSQNTNNNSNNYNKKYLIGIPKDDNTTTTNNIDNDLEENNTKRKVTNNNDNDNNVDSNNSSNNNYNNNNNNNDSNNNTNNDQYSYLNINKLPRLYVGNHNNNNNNNHNNNNNQPTIVSSMTEMMTTISSSTGSSSSTELGPVLSSRFVLYQDAIIFLSENPIHYLTTVLRITPTPTTSSVSLLVSEKPSSRRSSTSRRSITPPFVRIFDGTTNQYGYEEEWLGEVVVLNFDNNDDDMSSSSSSTTTLTTSRSSSNKKQQQQQQQQQQRKGNSRNSIKKDGTIVIICRKLLRTTRTKATDVATTTTSTTTTTTQTIKNAGVVDDQQQQQFGSNCWLCVAPIHKNKDRLRWMIEKTTELNCAGYIFTQTDYTEKDNTNKYGSKQQLQQQSSSSKNSNNSGFVVGIPYDKLQSYSIEASEQCERLTIPKFISYYTTTNNNNPQSITTTTPTNPNIIISDPLTTTPTTDIGTVPLSDFVTGSLQYILNNNKNNNGMNSNIRFLICRERYNVLPVWDALDQIYTTFNKEVTRTSSSIEERNDKDNNDDRNTNNDGTNVLLSICFLIGPEGGWSNDEELLLDLFERNVPAGYVYNVSLGPTILRAETAAIVATTAHTLFLDHQRRQQQQKTWKNC